MGIFDRLRRQQREADVPEEQPDSSLSASAGDLESRFGEQRGDFMLLPPLMPTFSSPARIQRDVDDFLVTHRPIAVANEPLTHDIEPARLGVVSARARRSRARMRPRRADIVHRPADDVETEPDLDESPVAVDLPAPLPPRRLSAATRRAPTAPPTSVLPTIADVRAAVIDPAPVVGRVAAAAAQPIAPSSPAAPSFDPTTLPKAALAEDTSSLPVLRRRVSRGRVMEPIREEDEPRGLGNELLEFSPEDFEPAVGDLPDAPARADLPPLTGATRVRGAALPQAPEALPSSTPTPSATPDDASPVVPTGDGVTGSDVTVPETVTVSELVRETQGWGSAVPRAPQPSGQDPELVHRGPDVGPEADPPGSSKATDSAPHAPEPLPVSGPAPSSRPAQPSMPSSMPAPRAAAPVEPVADGAPEPDAPLPNPVPLPVPVPGPTTSGPASVARSRATLGQRAPLVSPGRTGVQRLARDAAASTPSRPPMAQPVGRSSAPEPAQASNPASMPAPSTPAPAPALTAVPQRVRDVVERATGSAPAVVPVHRGEHVDAMTDDVKAQAFTRDGEIHLARDVDLGTSAGEAVLAHELTHVVQQGRSSDAMPAEDSEAGQAHERQARDVQQALTASVQAPASVEPTALHHAAPAESVDVSPVIAAQFGPQASGSAASTLTPPWSPMPMPIGGQAPHAAVSSRSGGGRPSSDSSVSNATGRATAAMASVTANPVVQPAPVELALRTVRSSAPASAPASATGHAHALAPAGVQRLARDEPTPDVSVPAVRAGRDVFDPTAGEDAPAQERQAKWYESGGKLDSLFSTSQGYDDGDDEDDDPRAGLEQQAESLYPLIRSRLRAELVRDRERRGRMAREWR